MAEETAFGIGHFRTFQTYVTLTFDRVIQHTTSTYIPNFIQIGKLFVDGRTGRWISRPAMGVDLIILPVKEEQKERFYKLKLLQL